MGKLFTAVKRIFRATKSILFKIFHKTVQGTSATSRVVTGTVVTIATTVVVLLLVLNIIVISIPDQLLDGLASKLHNRAAKPPPIKILSPVRVN